MNTEINLSSERGGDGNGEDVGRPAVRLVAAAAANK